jgi:hypothetical protein
VLGGSEGRGGTLVPVRIALGESWIDGGDDIEVPVFVSPRGRAKRAGDVLDIWERLGRASDGIGRRWFLALHAWSTVAG